MHESVMSSSTPWWLLGADLLLSLRRADTGRCFSKIEALLKIQACGGGKTHPTVQHKSNCTACFLCYRITCWWDDGSLSLNNAITIGCMIPGSPLRVNNITVILGSVINYDYEIMIIKKGGSVAHPRECVVSLIRHTWWGQKALFWKILQESLMTVTDIFVENNYERYEWNLKPKYPENEAPGATITIKNKFHDK